MGDKDITVYLGLEESLRDMFEGQGREYEILKKNIGSDKNALVEEVYNYLLAPQEDELNPEGYTEKQKDMAEFIKENYEGKSNPFLTYESNAGGSSFMYFDDKLSSYPDAFHEGSSEGEEFGNLEEEILEEEVYLKAANQATGGKKK